MQTAIQVQKNYEAYMEVELLAKGEAERSQLMKRRSVRAPPVEWEFTCLCVLASRGSAFAPCGALLRAWAHCA